MKKIFVLLILLFISMPAFAFDYDFKDGYISDNAEFFTSYYVGVLNNVIKNLHKDTGADFVIITLPDKGSKTFKDVEEDVLKKYKIGGENRTDWVMLIVTKEPYRMDIRRGENFKKNIPNTMRRAFGFEFFLHRIFLPNVNENQRRRSNAQLNHLYSLSSSIAEIIADKYEKRVYYSENISFFDIDYPQRQYFPVTDPAFKFIRRYNLLPSVLVFIIFIVIPYLIIFNNRRYRRYRRRYFW